MKRILVPLVLLAAPGCGGDQPRDELFDIDKLRAEARYADEISSESSDEAGDLDEQRAAALERIAESRRISEDPHGPTITNIDEVITDFREEMDELAKRPEPLEPPHYETPWVNEEDIVPLLKKASFKLTRNEEKGLTYEAKLKDGTMLYMLFQNIGEGETDWIHPFPMDVLSVRLLKFDPDNPEESLWGQGMEFYSSPNSGQIEIYERMNPKNASGPIRKTKNGMADNPAALKYLESVFGKVFKQFKSESPSEELDV